MGARINVQHTVLSTLVTLIVACSGNTGAGGTAAMTAADTAGIGRARDDLSARLLAGDAKGVIAGYADSAVFVGTGSSTLRGRAALQGYLVAGIAAAKATTFELHPFFVAGHDGVVTEIGTQYQVVVPTGQPALQAWGRYQLVWTRQVDGGWKVLTDVSVDDSSHAMVAATGRKP